jgi:uncharacterized protein with PQ loop repeat
MILLIQCDSMAKVSMNSIIQCFVSIHLPIVLGIIGNVVSTATISINLHSSRKYKDERGSGGDSLYRARQEVGVHNRLTAINL